MPLFGKLKKNDLKEYYVKSKKSDLKKQKKMAFCLIQLFISNNFIKSYY